jgi:alcohol dehydrogenase
MFTFSLKTTVIFGEGAAEKLPEIVAKLGASRSLIVTSSNLASLGLIRTVEEGVRAGKASVESYLLDDREPTPEALLAGFEFARSRRYDLILGVGGGSCIDSAKLIAAALTQGIGVAEILRGADLRQPSKSTIMIPTTSGTGAEITPNAVYVDNADGIKRGVVSEYLVPTVALIDPRFTRSMPRELTAATGLDALAHSLESFVSTRANALSALFSRESISLTFKFLKKACANGDDMEARTQMALASLYGGIALSNSGTCGAHALAYPLGGRYRIPHGVTVAILLLPVMRFFEPEIRDKLNELASYVGLGRTAAGQRDLFLGELETLIAEMGITRKLASWGISEMDLEWLTRAALKVDRLLGNNPKQMTQDDISGLYRQIL